MEQTSSTISPGAQIETENTNTQVAYVYKSPWIIWRKVIFIAVFFVFTPFTLLMSIFSLASMVNADFTDKPKLARQPAIISAPQSGAHLYAALPAELPSVSGEIVSEDARIEILENYMEANKSPLAPYAGFIVETSDKYGLDYRLLVAIAQKESGLCRVIPEDSHNCWGYGIHSKGTLKFDTWEQGVETVSRGLKQNYIDKGYVTVEEIMKKYAHPSSTTWADGVNFYMDQIQ